MEKLYSALEAPNATAMAKIAKNLNSSLFQAQIVVLAVQILWSEDVEAALVGGGGDALARVLQHVENVLNILADSVLQEQPPLRRRKLEHLVSNRL